MILHPYTNLIGKTIVSLEKMKKPEYDDTGYLKLNFSDGTFAVIWAGYESYTGNSEDEYPTRIGATASDEGLVAIEKYE